MVQESACNWFFERSVRESGIRFPYMGRETDLDPAFGCAGAGMIFEKCIECECLWRSVGVFPLRIILIGQIELIELEQAVCEPGVVLSKRGRLLILKGGAYPSLDCAVD